MLIDYSCIVQCPVAHSNLKNINTSHLVIYSIFTAINSKRMMYVGEAGAPSECVGWIFDPPLRRESSSVRAYAVPQGVFSLSRRDRVHRRDYR